MKTVTSLMTILSLTSLTACASIIEGSTDKLNVATNPPTRASCTATNASNRSVGTASGMISDIKKSKTDLQISCIDSATGGQGSKIIQSEFDSITFMGGLIGLPIDAVTGAMWNYPQEVTVQLNVTAPTPYAAPAPQTYAPPAAAAAPVAAYPAPAAAPAQAPAGYIPPAVSAPAPAAPVTPTYR